MSPPLRVLSLCGQLLPKDSRKPHTQLWSFMAFVGNKFPMYQKSLRRKSVSQGAKRANEIRNLYNTSLSSVEFGFYFFDRRLALRSLASNPIYWAFHQSIMVEIRGRERSWSANTLIPVISLPSRRCALIERKHLRFLRAMNSRWEDSECLINYELMECYSCDTIDPPFRLINLKRRARLCT